MDLDEFRHALGDAASGPEIDVSAARAAVGSRAQRRRRGQWTVGLAVALLAALGVTTIVVSRTQPRSTVSVAGPSSPPAECATPIDPVPATEVPHDVSTWAGGAPVLGEGALWTIRSAVAVPAVYQQNGWSLKFPWYTRPFGLPTLGARRLDGAGTFRASVDPATDARGTWVASSLMFSNAGCWEVTGRFETSSLRFRLRVGRVDSLQAAAVAWANAFLTGSLDDMKNLQGPECASSSPSTVSPGVASSYLRGLRAQLEQQLGRPLDTIKIRGVRVRNVTNTSGQAEVEYDLTQSAVGNDNWVSYELRNGQWKVSDCHAPIGGSSSTNSGTATP